MHNLILVFVCLLSHSAGNAFPAEDAPDQLADLLRGNPRITAFANSGFLYEDSTLLHAIASRSEIARFLELPRSVRSISDPELIAEYKTGSLTLPVSTSEERRIFMEEKARNTNLELEDIVTISGVFVLNERLLFWRLISDVCLLVQGGDQELCLITLDPGKSSLP